MKVGVQLPEVEYVARWSELRQMAETAEGIGLDSIWVGDHLLYRGDGHPPRGPWEAWTTLGAIAAVTQRVALGPLVAATSFHNPAMIAKKELRLIPLYGWYSWRAGTIWVDRRRGPAALRGLVRGAREALDAGRVIAVFPQGTRTAPGQDAAYQPGIAALYAGTRVPVVPVALNSGLFWPRRGFIKRPGTIVVEFLEPIPPGLSRAEFMSTLRHRIDAKTSELEAEAGFSRPDEAGTSATGPGPHRETAKEAVDNSVD